MRHADKLHSINGLASAGEHLMAILIGGVLVLSLIVGLVAVLGHRRQTGLDLDRPGLYGLTGAFGSGKTYFLAWSLRRAIKRGRPGYANFHLKGAQYLSTWEEVIAVPDEAFVALAELHLWWPVDVRRSPPGVDQWVSQLRHHGITCLWDSQHWTFVSTKFRKLTQGVWEAKRLGPGHQYTLFTAFGYGRRKTPRLARMRVRRSKDVMTSYDTKEDVRSNLDWIGDARPSEVPF